MPVTIQPSQIQNLQQMQVGVAGPEDANQLFIIDGQFDSNLGVSASGPGLMTAKEAFSVLVGPALSRKQFVKANATASIAKTHCSGGMANWSITNVDADWDDESGQVELRIEAQVGVYGPNQGANILGFLFHVTILAAVPAA